MVKNLAGIGLAVLGLAILATLTELAREIKRDWRARVDWIKSEGRR